MLAILIGLLTILTWHFTRSYTTKSLNGLAYGLRYELLQRPILRMWNILNSTVEITTAQVKLSEYVIRRYNKPVAQAEQVEVFKMGLKRCWFFSGKLKSVFTFFIYKTMGKRFLCWKCNLIHHFSSTLFPEKEKHKSAPVFWKTRCCLIEVHNQNCNLR